MRHPRANSGSRTWSPRPEFRRLLRIMQQAGIEIGAHTVSHPILSRLEPAEARREIEESRAQLADIVRAPVLTFAYPNGRPLQDYAAEHVRVVRGAGFALAVSTAWGAMRGSCDVFQVPRIAPWDSSAPAFGARLLRAYAQADAARA
jgi:peptidoglycan/xylan/chitin deacetylase (PgdA/CDA1 family)